MRVSCSTAHRKVKGLDKWRGQEFEFGLLERCPTIGGFTPARVTGLASYKGRGLMCCCLNKLHLRIMYHFIIGTLKFFM